MSERWMPKHGELYYYISTTGVVTPEKFNECDAGKKSRCFCGNCFRTVEEAKAAAEKVKALLLSLHYNGTSTANSETLKGTFTECLKKFAEHHADVILQKARERRFSEQYNNAPEETKLPKLTAEVFNRPDCPENAKIAVVNDDGSAYWGSFNTARQNFRGGWNGENGSWFPIPGKWDASDWQNSLIERPEKKTLPDWCKVGEWVYVDPEKVFGPAGYKKIKATDGLGLTFADGCCIYFSDKIKQARIRPWTAREAIRKIVCWEGDYSFQENMAIINAVDCDGNLMGDLLGNINLENLTKKCFYQLDNAPCGVLEHLENGKWVQ